LAYGQYHAQQHYIDQAMDLLKQLPPENNAIIHAWTSRGYKIQSAWDSQGVLHQLNHACHAKLCAGCPIGTDILKKSYHPIMM